MLIVTTPEVDGGIAGGQPADPQRPFVQKVCGTSNLEIFGAYVPWHGGWLIARRAGSGLCRSEADVIGSGADGSAAGKAGCA
jgi:hypothetical protein